MKNAYNYASIILAALTLSGCAQSGKETAANSAAEAANPEVVAIYYPHWHVYPCGEKWFGKGWTEWEFVKSGKPRFKGHKYTLRPMAGYLDGAKPEDVEKEIEIASNAGIGTFLFDWYWYDGKMTMQESLEKGFFGAKNFGKMKFAIMWANHDRLNQFRPDIDKPREMLMKIARTPEDFFAAIDYCADNYFNKPNYWRVNEKLFFSIFNPEFVGWNGGPEKVKKMLAQANEKMKAKGLPPVHWNAMTFEPAKADKLKAAGFDSVTSYGIVSTPKELKTKFADNPFIDDYSDTATFHRATWEEMRKRKIPYIPNVTRGWDSSLRCKLDEPFPYRKREYPYGRTVVNNRVDIFEGLLRDAKAFAKTTGANAVLINAWNEYTEGSYLMPSDADCDASLRAVAAVFGRNPKDRYVYVDRYKGKIFDIPAPTCENLSYGKAQKNKIDIWLPKGANGKTPLLVYIHGGGWLVGGMEDRIIASSLQRLLDNKIAVACVGYRFLADAERDGVFPPVAAPMQDCLDAINFLKANAAKWNIDTSKIALSGGSAGACSALYCALADNCAIGAKAVCVFVPQTSLDPKQMREWISNINYGARAYGCKNLDEALQKRAKLLPYIEKYSPAALLEKCDAKKAPVFAMQFNEDIANTKPSKDPVHSAKFGVNFKKLCEAKGVECEVYTSQKFEDMFDRIIKSLK